MNRLNRMNRLLHREVEILEMEQNIQRQVQENMSQNQKDAFLREQVRVIQEELGEDGDNEIAAYRRQIADARLPEEVEEKLLKEVMHLESSPTAPPRPLFCATTWTCAWSCPGPRHPRSGPASRLPERSWMRTTLAWKRSRSASWSLWLCSSWPPS